MADFDQFAKGLSDEVMTDMAETFFGNRARLEKDMDRYENHVQRLKKRLEAVCGRFVFLKKILPGDLMPGAFFSSLGAEPPVFPIDAPSLSQGFYPPPRAFTTKGRWYKYLLKSYGLFWRSLDEYMYGRYVPEKGKGVKKRLTVNRKSLYGFYEDLNSRIRELNSTSSPVCVLQYVKAMDPDQMEREKVTGATLSGYACSLDDKMSFAPVEFDSQVFPEFEPCPNPEVAEPLIKDFCNRQYGPNKRAIAKAMKSVASEME